ncbi:MAG: SdiA-regulated domain-containing protein [bacterium]
MMKSSSKGLVFCLRAASILLFLQSGLASVFAQNDFEISLNLIDTCSVAVPEPSGLVLDASGSFLWTVSDRTNQIYKLALSGETLDTLSYQGEDLEGITQNAVDRTLWVVEERLRQVVQLDTTGVELARTTVVLERKRANKGLEGITFNSTNGHLFVINEKSPKLLVELSEHLVQVQQVKLTFAKDYSGIVFDSSRDVFWIVSDGSRTLTQCDLQGQPQQTFALDIQKAEGIAIAPARKILFVISDLEEKLYSFEVPSGSRAPRGNQY